MFADDCVLYQIDNSWNNVYHMLQSDLDNFISWCDRNGLGTGH